MIEQETERVVGRGGLKGTVRGHIGPDGTDVEIELDNGQKMLVPASSLTLRPDGTYFIPFSLNDLSGSETAVLPVVREEVEVTKRREETAKVAVHITPHVRQEVVDVPVTDETVEVERIPMNRLIDAPLPIRYEGDLTIVPVFEEVVVIQKQLILKEEIHIKRRQTVRHEKQTVSLRSEEVHVLRSDTPSQNDPAKSPSGKPAA